MKTYFAEHLRLWGLRFHRGCVPARSASSRLSARLRGQPPQFILCELRTAPAAGDEAVLARYRQFEKTLAPLGA